MLKNKHFLVALIVAPILAILAWFATDIMVSEQPIKPEIGQSYSLAEKANCRWASGLCELKNNDIELSIKTTLLRGENEVLIKLESNVQIEGAIITLLSKGEHEMPPKNMQAKDNSGLNWRVILPWQADSKNRLRLAIKHRGVFFYGDVATIFMTTKGN